MLSFLSRILIYGLIIYAFLLIIILLITDIKKGLCGGKWKYRHISLKNGADMLN